MTVASIVVVAPVGYTRRGYYNITMTKCGHYYMNWV